MDHWLTVMQRVRALGAYTVDINDVGHVFDVTRLVEAREVGTRYRMQGRKIIKEGEMSDEVVGHSEDSVLIECKRCKELSLTEDSTRCPVCGYACTHKE